MCFLIPKTCACGRTLEIIKHKACNGEERIKRDLPSLLAKVAGRMDGDIRDIRDILDFNDLTNDSLLDAHQIMSISVKTITCSCTEPLTKVSKDELALLEPREWGHNALYLACGCRLAAGEREEYYQSRPNRYGHFKVVEKTFIIIAGVRCRRCAGDSEVDVVVDGLRGMSLNGDVTGAMVDLFKSFGMDHRESAVAAAASIDLGEGGGSVLTLQPK